MHFWECSFCKNLIYHSLPTPNQAVDSFKVRMKEHGKNKDKTGIYVKVDWTCVQIICVKERTF